MENTKIFNKELCKFDPKDVVYLKEYIIYFEEDTKDKYAIFKFYNNFHESITGLEFLIQQYDENDCLIAENVFKYSNFSEEKNKEFIPYTKLMVEDECKYLKSKLVKADFVGHHFEDFKLQSQKDYENTKRGLKPSRKEKNKVRVKRLKKKNKIRYFLLAPFLLASLVLVILGTIKLVNDFGENIKEFSDVNFRYSISNGEATVVEYISNKKNVEIIDSIDIGVKQFPVTGIGENVFELSEIETVKISAPSIEIGDSAFMECSKLTKVEANEISIVGENAFINCLLLNTFKSTKIETIENYGFYGCESLSSIDLSKTISIGKYAFGYAAGLTEIVSNSIEMVDSYAFDECVNITNISLPKAHLAEGVFEKVIPVERVVVGDFDCSFGEIFNTSNTDLPASLTEIVCNAEIIKQGMFDEIRSGVSIELSKDSIVNYKALSDYYSNLYQEKYYVNENVEILNGSIINVADIGNAVLSKDIIGEDYTGEVVAISPGAINPNITSVVIDFDNITLTKDTFAYATNLNSLELKGRVFVNDDALSTCEKLTYCILHEGVNDNNYGTFLSTSKITHVEYYGESLIDYSFENATNIKNVNVYNTNNVGIGVFKGCSSLENVWFEQILTEVTDELFSGCKALNYFELYYLKRIGNYAFYGCEALNPGVLSFQNVLESIGDHAFDGCIAINIIEFYNATNLTYIGVEAFSNLKRLNYIDLLPVGIESPQYLFGGENNIYNLNVYNYGNRLSDFGNFPNLESVYVTQHPNCYNFIYGFISGYEKLTYIDLPTVTGYETDIISNCPNLKKVSFRLGDVYNVIGSGLYNLRDVTIYNDNNIDFNYNNLNQSAEFTKSLSIYGTITGNTDLSSAINLNYLMVDTLNCNVLGNIFNTSNEFIPQTLRTVELYNTSINSEFFRDCNYIRNISLHSASYIYENALSNMDNLRNIYFGKQVVNYDWVEGFNQNNFSHFVNIIKPYYIYFDAPITLPNFSIFDINEQQVYSIYTPEGEIIGYYDSLFIKSNEDICDLVGLDGVVTFDLNGTSAETYGFNNGFTLYVIEDDSFTYKVSDSTPIIIDYHYEDKVETIAYNESQLTELFIPSLESGYFAGWYLDPYYHAKLEEGIIIYENCDLYAKIIYEGSEKVLTSNEIVDLSTGNIKLVTNYDTVVEIFIFSDFQYVVDVASEYNYYGLYGPSDSFIVELKAYEICSINLLSYESNVFVSIKFNNSDSMPKYNIQLNSSNEIEFNLIDGFLYNWYCPNVPGYEFIGWYDEFDNLIIDNTGVIYRYCSTKIYSKFQKIE